MPNTKSAAKRVRQTIKRTLRNRRVKSQIRTAIRKFEEAAQEDLNLAEERLRQALKSLDKAASKGVIHRNKAARKKSRLTRRFNKLKANQ